MFGENKDDKIIKIDISYNFILKLALIILGGLFLYLIRKVLAILLVSIVLTTAIAPFVDLMDKKKKLPRWIGILIIYAIIIGVFILVVWLLVPALIQEFQNLIDKIPYFYDLLNNKFTALSDTGLQGALKDTISNFVNNFANSGNTIFKSFSSIISGLGFAAMTLIITFYMSMEEDGTAKLVKAIVPKKYHVFALSLINKIQKTVGGWLKGQLSLCFIIATLYYIAFVIFGLNYSLLLAVFAGIVEIIPYLGPYIGAAPAVLIALTQSPIRVLFIVIVVFLIQQLENNLIVPKVMKKSVGLNPIIVIVVIMIGVSVAGPAGALLAVPVTAIIQVIAKEIIHLDAEGIFEEEDNDKKDGIIKL